jgi:hypothetical protein
VSGIIDGKFGGSQVPHTRHGQRETSRFAVAAGLIPSLSNHDLYVQSRNPMDMMRQG